MVRHDYTGIFGSITSTAGTAIGTAAYDSGGGAWTWSAYRSTTGALSWSCGDANWWVVVGLPILGVAAAPALSSPSGAATGPTQATIGVTSDTAPTTTAISYHILAAATAAPSAATIVGAPTGTITTGIAGALTAAITGLTTNTAVKAHYAQGTTSNVVSSASFTPNTLAIAATALTAQSVVTGAALTWAGVTPESLVTNTGNGTPGTAWTVSSGAGASGATCNASTGILVLASAGTAGSYTITLKRVDTSTVGTPVPQEVTKTVELTITGSAATAVTLAGPSGGVNLAASTNFTVGTNGVITGSLVVTPSSGGGGGTFTPTSVTLTSGSPTGAFTYTPSSTGAKSITVTNGGGLTNPAAITYTVTAAPATTLNLTGIAGAASLTGINGVVLSAAAPGAGVTVIKAIVAAAFDASGNMAIDITGLGVLQGQARYVDVTQSNGDPSQAPSPFGAHGPVSAS